MAKTEKCVAQLPLFGTQLYDKIQNVHAVYDKCGQKGNIDKGDLWKRSSIFWDIPYWKSLSVRHCLDVMHIEKNVCDSIIGTLLNISEKTKDGLKVRQDLEKEI